MCWWDKTGLGRCVRAVAGPDSSKLLEKVPQWIQFLSTDDEHNLFPGSPNPSTNSDSLTQTYNYILQTDSFMGFSALDPRVRLL